MDAQETKVFLLVLILVFVIGTIIVYFFISLLRQQRLNLELKKQNLIAELNSIEKERARIAADLHDEISPVLSAVKLKVSSFELHDEGDKIQQQKTDDHLDNLLKRMREISFDLMPVTLQRRGLKTALLELVSYWSNRNQLQIELTADDNLFSDVYSIHLYRIIQEIIHNTIKHAGATLLQIEIKKEVGKLTISSKDNGKGFDYAKSLEEGNGFGLRNLLSRADVLGGKIVVESQKNKGTIYTIEIPSH